MNNQNKKNSQSQERIRHRTMNNQKQKQKQKIILPSSNIVLISAATVLLLTSNLTTTAFETSTTAFVNRANNIKTRQVYSLNNFHLGFHNQGNNNNKINIDTQTSLQATENKKASSSSSSSSSSSWSKSSSSRIGVRKRVKSVLEKAKNRTGIRNNSEDDNNSTSRTSNGRNTSKRLTTTTSVPSVVADAAAIGGLGAVLLDETTGEYDVALDYVPPPTTTKPSSGSNSTETVNGGTNGGVNGLDRHDGTDDKSISPSNSASRKKKPSPASTYSPPVNIPEPTVDEILVKASTKSRSIPSSVTNGDTVTKTTSTSTASKSLRKNTSSSASSSKPSPSASKNFPELDALKSDVSAAFSLPPPPLPFTLPKLTQSQKDTLKAGERVQFQSDMGREGSGFVVVDVDAPAKIVWDCLLDFESYPETIRTVREIEMFTNTHLSQDYYSEQKVDPKKYEDGTLARLEVGTPSVTRAAFTLSKFRLKIAAIHKYRPHPMGDYMIFTLDPACTNMVLRNAKGVWYTETGPNVEGLKDGSTRVWLLCELKVSSLLPQWITDYAAKRAMPRASTWIKPHVEAAANLWLREDDD